MAITDYIPQRPPFVMVDELLDSQPESAVTQWVVPAENVLLEGSELQAAGLMENVAQSAAAWVGYQAKMQNQQVRIGYIGAVKQMLVHRLPHVGETLRTTIEVINTVFDITLVHAVVRVADEVLAEMDLKIALQ